MFFMFFAILMLATLGILHPDSRGAFLTIMIIFFIFLSGVSGYYSSRFFKMFGSSRWLINALVTSFLYPSLSFFIFFIINLFLWYEGSSAAVPFSTILTILVLWLCCSSPLVLIGAFIGMKKSRMKNPCKVNSVPQVVEALPWYCRMSLLCAVSGLFPFL